MSRSPLLLVPLGVAMLASAGVAADGIKVDSREYKLMLDPARFSGGQPTQDVDRFWDQHLAPLVAKRLDPREDGGPRHKARFKLEHEQGRQVVFRDAESCVLDTNGFALRERTKMKKGKPDPDERKLTLKFRTPELFLAAGTQWRGLDKSAKAKFEEDIAPLIERTRTESGKVATVFARPPSIRSLFSISVTQDLEPQETLQTLADVTRLNPGLEGILKGAGVKTTALDATLVKGDEFHERVYSGALVDLGHDTDAKLELTVWQRAGEQPSTAPEAAELSFKYDTSHGQVDRAVARRALALFLAMQDGLAIWTSPEHQTKTSLALPKKCKNE
jgi:hypothetical protein